MVLIAPQGLDRAYCLLPGQIAVPDNGETTSSMVKTTSEITTVPHSNPTKLPETISLTVLPSIKSLAGDSTISSL